MANRVLVLGGPSVGKTHYAGQLLGRLRHGKETALRLCPGGTDDVLQLEEVLGCLEEGRSAGHTPSETWTGIKCRLVAANGTEMDLVWPEYAGEKMLHLVDNRFVSESWRDSAAEAKVWVLIIRSSALRTYEDGVSRPGTSIAKIGRILNTGWDDQARYIELLQMLLFTSGRSIQERLNEPRLIILLSCWDEMPNSESPSAMLQRRLPLLWGFVSANWQPQQFSAWGLSSLGCHLDPKIINEEFRELGPENAGYVIFPESSEESCDLTLPLAWALRL